jgi:hypothetical protein
MTRSLRRKAEFRKVYGEGVKRVGQFLILYILPADDDARAVVASRKIGPATRRNRAKRLLRIALTHVFCPGPGAAARHTERFSPTRTEGLTGQDHAQGLWVVAVARRSILSARSVDVCKDVEQLLQLPS